MTPRKVAALALVSLPFLVLFGAAGPAAMLGVLLGLGIAAGIIALTWAACELWYGE